MTGPLPRCEVWLAVGSAILSKSHTCSVTSWWAMCVLATIAPRCLDVVGAVILMRCQQTMSLSGFSSPSYLGDAALVVDLGGCNCKGGLVSLSTPPDNLEVPSFLILRLEDAWVGGLGRAATEAVTSFLRSRMLRSLVPVEYGNLQPFWALALPTAHQ